MSHFTVLVIGDDPDRQLAPYHEFECTGVNDQYVQEIDQTEESRMNYEKQTHAMVRLADGTEVEKYDDRFYRDPTPEEEKERLIGSGCRNGVHYTSKDWGDGKGYRTKVHELPDDAVPFERPVGDTQSFVEFVKDWHGHEAIPFGDEPDIEGDHKYGYVLLKEDGDVDKVINRTNPNAKWDWYSIGGRWTGFFPLKEDAEGSLGRPGIFDNKPEEGTADQVRVRDIDFDRARQESFEAASKTFDKWEDMVEKHGTAKGWSEVREEYPDDTDKARQVYNAQPLIVAAKKEQLSGIFSCPVEVIGYDRVKYIEKIIGERFSVYAMVKDGEWTAQGEMGWFGFSDDKEDAETWGAKVRKALMELPEDTMLTLVDCHI